VVSESRGPAELYTQPNMRKTARPPGCMCFSFRWRGVLQLIREYSRGDLAPEKRWPAYLSYVEPSRFLGSRCWRGRGKGREGKWRVKIRIIWDDHDRGSNDVMPVTHGVMAQICTLLFVYNQIILNRYLIYGAPAGSKNAVSESKFHAWLLG
jgi:hypothetical protein